ncbi:MAG: hypothetical protein MMC33_002599 [Icmadophila ericetorum]|nr:hypothetical protein [Icmadophila ericetorum]
MSRSTRRQEVYSTLEIDPASIAPQVIHSNPAPQISITSILTISTCNVAESFDPEFALSREHLEVVPGQLEEKIPAHEHVNTWRQGRKPLWIGCFAFLAIAIALAVSIVVVEGRKGRPLASPTPSPGVAPPTVSNHCVLGNSSLASTISSSDVRYLYFQEKSGTIREAIYDGTQWVTSIDSIVATDGRYQTPMSVSYISGNALSLEQIILFYVNINNTVVFLANGAGVWNTPTIVHTAEGGALTLPNTSTVLSASVRSYTPNTSDSTVLVAYVFYKDHTGAIQGLYGYDLLPVQYDVSPEWQTVNFSITSPPTASGSVVRVNAVASFAWSALSGIELFFGIPTAVASNGNISFFTNSTVGLDLIVGICSPRPLKPAGQTAPFPYSRLASPILEDYTPSSGNYNSSLLYLYHRLDDAAIAEEAYNSNLNLWLPTNNITIATT